MFDEDFHLQIVWRRQHAKIGLLFDQWRLQQHIAKYLFENGGHFVLLDETAVILDGQNDRIRRSHESMCFDRFYNVKETDFRSNCQSVVDDGYSVWAVPTV